MKNLEKEYTKIASFNYKRYSSSVYWFPDDRSTIEILELKPGTYLLQGSREYKIKDVYDVGEFQRRYGMEGEEYHSRLASVGTFSDYLKEAVPSFEMSIFYINSLSSGIERIEEYTLSKEIRELKKRIEFKEEKIGKLEFDKESDLPVGKEIISLKSEVSELKNELKNLQEKSEINKSLREEYKRRGVGAIFLVRIKSPAHICDENRLEETIYAILDDLKYKNKIIKSQAWSGFKIIIEDLEDPTLWIQAESVGLFDPRSLEEFTNQYRYNELKDITESIEKIFLHRPAKEIRIGETRLGKSSAIAQGIASLMRRSASKQSIEKELPEPDFSKLPSIQDEEKRLAYMGFILEDGIIISEIPVLFDFDEQGPQHTIIVGGTGSGKTICASNLAEGALIQNIPVLVLDTSKQWTGFLRPCQSEDMIRLYKKFGMKNVEPTGFNGKIFTPNSNVGINLETNLLLRPEVNRRGELQQCAYEIAAIIKVICNLSGKETTYVRAVILDEWERGKDLNFVTLRKRLEEWGKANDKNVFETKLKLEELEGYPFLFSGEKLDITKLWKQGEISVAVLSHLTDAQKIYTSYFLMRELLSYFYSQPDSRELKLLVILEEAHRFIPKNTPGIPNELYLFLDRVIRELRRKGVGTIFISQVMTDFKESIRANTATKIRLRTAYDGDILRASRDIGSIFANYLPKLKTGQGIVSFPNYGNPFFVQFRPPLHNPFALSDEEIMEEMKIFKEKSKIEYLVKPEVDEIKKLTEKDLRAIRSISPKIYNVVKSIRANTGITYNGDASKILSSKFREIKEKLQDIPEGKLNALKELSPEIYEIIKSLKQILNIEREIKIPEEELVFQKIKELNDETGLPQKPSDIVKDLKWGWKKVNEIVEKLEEQGRIKKKSDSRDKRIKRLIPLE